MKESTKDALAYLAVSLVILAFGFSAIAEQIRITRLEKIIETYEERQLALISQDKAIRQELSDLKRYIETGEASGG